MPRTNSWDFLHHLKGYIDSDSDSSFEAPISVAPPVAAVPGAVFPPQPHPRPGPPIRSKVNPDDEALNLFLNGLRATAEVNIANHFETMDPIRWIGKIVTNDHEMPADGVPDIGGVINYFPDRKVFQVVYRSGSIGFIDLEKLQGQRYIATLVGEDRDDIKFDPRLARWSNGVIDAEEIKDNDAGGEAEEFTFLTAAGSTGPPLTASASSSRPDDKGKGVAKAAAAAAPRKRQKLARRARRPRTKQEDPSTYVALALRENKADDYYWYSD